MAIRRFTIELDDSSEARSPTSVPVSLTGREPVPLKERGLTAVPEPDDSVEADPKAVTPAPVTVGRTFPDLIREFIDQPRAMATTLFFLPFPVFVVKISNLESLLYPILTGCILNFVWFTVPLLSRLVERRNTDT